MAELLRCSLLPDKPKFRIYVPGSPYVKSKEADFWEGNRRDYFETKTRSKAVIIQLDFDYRDLDSNICCE